MENEARLRSQRNCLLALLWRVTHMPYIFVEERAGQCAATRAGSLEGQQCIRAIPCSVKYLKDHSECNSGVLHC